MRTALAITSGLIAAVLILFGVDAATGVYLHAARKNSGLIWAPDSTVEHATTEFHYFTQVNNLGFRGRDFSRAKRGKIRIAIIGDSFTYGWGLDLKQTWPEILEKCLRGLGRDVEVANLGVPGTGPLNYADLAPRALALLHPDLLLIAVVQADDITQCSDQDPGASLTARQRMAGQIARVLPALATVAGLTPSAKIHLTAEDLRAIWKKQAHDFIRGDNPEDQARFQRLPQRLRELYVQGNVNPGLIYYAFRRPRLFVDTANPQVASTKADLAVLADRLGRMRRAADRYGTRAMVVSIPNRVYMSVSDMEAMREFGFEVDPALIGSSKPDEVIRGAAGRAGLPFIAVTPHFQEQARSSELYFPIDGHFNARGAHLYATLLAPEIASHLSQ